MTAPKGPMIKIGDQFYPAHPTIAEELNKVRRELRDAQVLIGLTLSPDQQYYSGTPAFEVMTELHQLRDFRKSVEKILAESTEYFDWTEAIASIDRIRQQLKPLMDELKKTEEQT